MKSCWACDEAGFENGGKGDPEGRPCYFHLRRLGDGRSLGGWKGLILLCWVVALLVGCGPQEIEAPEPRPVVLITLGSVRADLVGALGGEVGWTPEIDRFATQSQWRGTAVASSSSPLAAMATLLTGVDPWHHQVLGHANANLEAELPTLGQAFSSIGYATAAILPAGSRLDRYGFTAGFEEIVPLDDDGAAARLASMGGGARFLWVHLPDVGFPYRDRRQEIPRLADRPRTLDKVDHRWLMPFTDPGLEIPSDLAAAAAELYRHEVAWGDQRFGRLLDALRSAPAWSESLVAVTAILGTELGEHGQALYAQNLGRESLEVPLFLKLPAEAGMELAEQGGRPVAAGRLWATLLEAAGGQGAPVHQPSLWVRSDAPALSALFDYGGANLFSAVFPSDAEGSAEQLLWRSRHGAPEPEFHLALAVRSGRSDLKLTEPQKRIFDRLRRRFRQTRPFSESGRSDGGAVDPEVEAWIERWPADGGFVGIEDPALLDALAASTEFHWRRFVEEERSPAEELARRLRRGPGGIVPGSDDRPKGP
ncbi:MAG: sulfatase-like hydrolase/transferase [Acidobacteriota bacterium]